jgi:hypothetical protein
MYENTDRVNDRKGLIHGLGALDTPSTTAFLKEQAKNPETDDVLQYAAIRSIGESQKEKEVEFIADFLNSPDPQARLAAAEALQKIDDSKSRAILKKYRSVEKEKWIISRLDGVFLDPISFAQKSEKNKAVVTEDEKFTGIWRGYWVVPRQNSPQGMTSEVALLSLQSGPGKQVTGILHLKKQGLIRKFQISQGRSKPSAFSGILIEEASRQPIVSSKPLHPLELRFQAEVFKQAGSQIIHLRVSEKGGVLIVRKDS